MVLCKKISLCSLLLLMLFLAACGNQPATSQNTPKAGGTLIVALADDSGPFNPVVTTGFFTHFITDQIFNGLVGLDDQLNPIPELAASWEISEGGKVYIFHLRSGVLWQDGQPFTSADVKFTFEQGLLKYHSRTKAGIGPALASIDTPDPLTVVFRFKQAYGSLLQRLNVVEASIIPQHIYEGKDLLKDSITPIGTGPFKFVDFVKGDHITLERNPHYFRAGFPYLNTIIFRTISQPEAAAQALEQEMVDYLDSVPGADISRLRNNPQLTLAQGFGGSGGSLCQDTLSTGTERRTPSRAPG